MPCIIHEFCMKMHSLREQFCHYSFVTNIIGLFRVLTEPKVHVVNVIYCHIVTNLIFRVLAEP